MLQVRNAPTVMIEEQAHCSKTSKKKGAMTRLQEATHGMQNTLVLKNALFFISEVSGDDISLFSFLSGCLITTHTASAANKCRRPQRPTYRTRGGLINNRGDLSHFNQPHTHTHTERLPWVHWRQGLDCLVSCSTEETLVITAPAMATSKNNLPFYVNSQRMESVFAVFGNTSFSLFALFLSLNYNQSIVLLPSGCLWSATTSSFAYYLCTCLALSFWLFSSHTFNNVLVWEPRVLEAIP